VANNALVTLKVWLSKSSRTPTTHGHAGHSVSPRPVTCCRQQFTAVCNACNRCSNGGVVMLREARGEPARKSRLVRSLPVFAGRPRVGAGNPGASLDRAHHRRAGRTVGGTRALALCQPLQRYRRDRGDRSSAAVSCVAMIDGPFQRVECGSSVRPHPRRERRIAKGQPTCAKLTLGPSIKFGSRPGSGR